MIFILFERHEEWQDFEVSGVFSTREKAYEERDRLKGLDKRFEWYYNVKAYELDKRKEE